MENSHVPLVASKPLIFRAHTSEHLRKAGAMGRRLIFRLPRTSRMCAAIFTRKSLPLPLGLT